MNKSFVTKCCNIAQSTSNQFTSTNITNILVGEHGIGHTSGKVYHISNDQRRSLKQFLENKGYDWTFDTKKLNGSRTDVSEFSTNDKISNEVIEKSHLRIRPYRGNTLSINGEECRLPTGSFLTIDEDSHFDCDILLLIENKEAFWNLDQYIIDGDLGNKKITAVFRGDPEVPHSQRRIKDFLVKNTHVDLMVFADYDPAGLEIALTVFPGRLKTIVLPDIVKLNEINGSEADFIKQKNQFDRLKPPMSISKWVDYLAEKKEGFTQERMLATNVSFQMVPINYC